MAFVVPGTYPSWFRSRLVLVVAGYLTRSGHPLSVFRGVMLGVRVLILGGTGARPFIMGLMRGGLQ